jgi:hypothetical protein
MGGPGAPDDLRLGHHTQEWLATSDDSEARISGGYWYHQRRAEPAPSVRDERFQEGLLEELARFTGTRLDRPAPRRRSPSPGPPSCSPVTTSRASGQRRRS